MKKKLVCLIMCCLVVFTGCSSKTPDLDAGNVNNLDESNVSEDVDTTEDVDVTEEADTTEEMDTADEELTLEELFQKGMDSYAEKNIEPPVLFPETDIAYLENFYPGISYANIKQIYVAMAPVTNAPMEIALVEVADGSDVAAIRDIFQERIDERANDTAYPEESAIWKKNAKVTIRGNFIFMAVMTDDYGIPEEFILD